MKLNNRIEKYESNLTNTQKYIAKKLIELDQDVVKSSSIENLSWLISVSTTTLYGFVKNLGFKNIYEFREFLNEEKIDKSRLATEIDKTITYLERYDYSVLLKDIEEAEEIVILSKGFGKVISNNLERKLRKIGINVSEIIGESGLDLLVKNKKYFIIYITVSGRFINGLSSDMSYLMQNYPSLVITHSKPPKQSKTNYFKHILYGKVISDYPREEFEDPNNTLILTMQLVNWLTSKIKKGKPLFGF